MDVMNIEQMDTQNVSDGIVVNGGWVSSKNELLMTSLTKYFSHADQVRRMLPILQGKSNISLRVLDWFVTNYCKKQNVSMEIMTEGGESKRFMIYLDYKSQLKAYSKKQFDPFCRRERIRFVYGTQTGQEFITTVGQLNFFRWMLNNRILDYVEEHLEEIENDMNMSIRNHVSKKWSQYPTYEGYQDVSSNTTTEQSECSDEETFDSSIATLKSPQIVSIQTMKTPNIASCTDDGNTSVRKKRQELSINATKTVNKHNVTILVEFN